MVLVRFDKELQRLSGNVPFCAVMNCGFRAEGQTVIHAHGIRLRVPICELCFNVLKQKEEVSLTNVTNNA